MKWQSDCISFRYFTKVILKNIWIIFLFVKCKSLFFKVANDQRPDHSLFGQFRHDKYIYIYIYIYKALN